MTKKSWTVKRCIRDTVSKQDRVLRYGRLAKRSSFYQRLKNARANLLRWKPELVLMKPHALGCDCKVVVQPMTEIKLLPPCILYYPTLLNPPTRQEFTDAQMRKEQHDYLTSRISDSNLGSRDSSGSDQIKDPYASYDIDLGTGG